MADSTEDENVPAGWEKRQSRSTGKEFQSLIKFSFRILCVHINSTKIDIPMNLSQHVQVMYVLLILNANDFAKLLLWEY